jgi:hypothetical protein
MVIKGYFSMVVLLVAVLYCPISAHATKHALLIGISDYRASGLTVLEGTLNDLELVRQGLKRFGFEDKDISILRNAEANHEGVRQAFTDLAKRVGKDDFVYIHYSGHGSLTPNLNGEKKPKYVGGTAYDSTWVSYGSRPRGGGKELNAFDILNEEIGEWLVPIYVKTDNVAFVSDSCHAGNMTRGEAPKVRAGDKDLRPHPLGKRKFARSSKVGVIIGAAREDQQAGEFGAPDGKTYGLFTWHWVLAMFQTVPGDTWNDLFKRSIALIGSERAYQQHPMIEGTANRSAFGGDFPPLQLTIAVSEVSSDGAHVKVKAGKFAGMTPGSTFIKKEGEAAFVLTEVGNFDSAGDITKGLFRPGDLAVEETHVYTLEPTRLFVRADLPADEPLAASLRAAVTKLPGYTPASSQKEADLLFVVIRPKGEAGADQEALPPSDPEVKPQIWFLTDQERLTRERIMLREGEFTQMIKRAAENLTKMARVRDLKALGVGAAAGAAVVELRLARLVPDRACKGNVCQDIPERGIHRREAFMPAQSLEGESLRKGDILVYEVRNTSAVDLYCYTIEISPDGQIKPIHPDPKEGISNEAVLVKAGTTRYFGDDIGIELTDPGNNTIKLIASQMPLDITLFQQSSYATRGERGFANPLEQFVAQTMTGKTRGGISTNNRTSKWGVAQVSVEVK